MNKELTWDDFNKFDVIDNKYLPDYGEGETFIEQIVTAVTKLTYKWFNDGDVFDNSYYLCGWCNDLSNYANWLYEYVPETRKILDEIYKITSEEEYINLLYELNVLVMNEEFLSKYKDSKLTGTIYNCEGDFKYTEDDGEGEENYY